ncbi:hypothetical protein SRHO_G00214570 [Serrasalmus rhombeus]
MRTVYEDDYWPILARYTNRSTQSGRSMQISDLHVSVREMHMALLTVATSTPAAGCLLRKTKPVSPSNSLYSSCSRSMFLRGTPLENLDSSGTIARGFLSKDLGRVHLSCFHFIGLRHPSSFSIYTFLSP